MGLAVMRDSVRGGGAGLVVMRGGSMGYSGIAAPVGCPFAVRAYDRCIARVSVIAAKAAVISSAAGVDKAMAAPTVVITPAGPWTHAQEDTVVEVTRPVKSNGRAGVRCIVVVTVGTHRLNPDANDYLRIRRWRIRFQDPERKQCGREQCF